VLIAHSGYSGYTSIFAAGQSSYICQGEHVYRVVWCYGFCMQLLKMYGEGAVNEGNLGK
jgi:hypothetical protein